MSAAKPEIAFYAGESSYSSLKTCKDDYGIIQLKLFLRKL